MYRIKKINAIAPEGLALLGKGFTVDENEADPHGILVRSSKVNVEDYPSLLAVARAGAGINNITVGRATEQGVCVFNTPGANANAVVELVLTMLGSWLRNVPEGVAFCRSLRGLQGEEMSRRVEGEKKRFRGIEMAGKTLGVIGLGQIGTRIANAGARMRMRVLGFDPFPSLENVHQLDPEVRMAKSYAEVAVEADFLSLHVPLADNTRGLVDARFLSAMRSEAILINYARGPVVVEADLIAALDAGRLAGHITDFPSPAFLGHDQVLVTPHLGASTSESEENCACMAVAELKDYLEYGHVSHSVNFPNAESIPTRKIHTRLIMINRDQPGMIGVVSNILGRNGLNIASFLNESNGKIGYNIIDLEVPVPDEVLAEIEADPGVIRTRTICFAR